jgi:hypothetical protein
MLGVVEVRGRVSADQVNMCTSFIVVSKVLGKGSWDIGQPLVEHPSSGR